MSRKNRNSGGRKYNPKTYGPGYLAPTPIEKILAEAKRSEMKPAAVSERIMCDDSCSYEHKRLPAHFLETDFSYQRKIDTARVDRIADNFDARLVNEVKVSNRDGKFYVFDGAHTLSALKRVHGDDDFLVDCKVFYGLTYEDEAYLFALQSGESKDVAFGVRLRALLASSSDEAVAFKKATAEGGFDLAENNSNASQHTIAALAKAYKLYKDYGAEQYKEILSLIGATWGGAAWSVTSYILGGVAVFLREYGTEYKRERFIKRLRGATYDDLRDEARRQMRGSSDVAHALALVKAYNRAGGIGTVDPRRLTILD